MSAHLIVAVFTSLVLGFAAPQALWAQGFLENPQPGSFQSGISVISGWVCSASRIDIEIDGTTFQAAYGTSREDTRSVCGDANNGFGLLINWNLFGCGEHKVRALADGVEFANVMVTVATFGTEFLRGASGRFTLENFPQAGTNVFVRWQESLQNFVIEGAGGGGDGNSGSPPRVLENPQPGSFQSGIGVISGWVCSASRIDIEIDGTLFQAAYGTSREDTRSVCGDANNGFGLLINWNLFGDGEHTVRALSDSVEFANVTVTVTTFGTEFLRGASGWFTLEDFPREGFNVKICWQESLQNFVIEGVTINLSGEVFNNPSERQPVTDATVTIEDEEVQVGEDGSVFSPFPFCRGKEPPLTITFGDSSQNIYRIKFNKLDELGGAGEASLAGSAATASAAATASSVAAASVDFFVDPVAADSKTPGVTVTPTLAAPGGTATITDPQDDEEIICAPPPEVCRFLVQGDASPFLGQPGTKFSLFVSVTPISPPGGGTFLQFPPVSVDPETGEWATSAQIGSEELQAQEGDVFEILAIVTEATLPTPIEGSLRFDRPVDIPGVVHISQFVDLTVGPRGGTPTLSISPTPLDFGEVEVNSFKDLTFTVTNSGGSTLTGSATTSSPFSIVSGSTFSLGAGASQTVTVRFSPTSSGSFSGGVSVSSNGGSARVSLSGTAGINTLTVVGEFNGPDAGALRGLAWDGTTLWSNTSPDGFSSTIYKHNLDASLSVKDSCSVATYTTGITWINRQLWSVDNFTDTLLKHAPALSHMKPKEVNPIEGGNEVD